MELTISEQALVFLYSCFLGVALGVVYDVFRILRLAVKIGPVIIFIQDTVYFIITAFSTFTFLLFFTEGQIRVYVLIGEFLGFTLYYFTVGKLVFNASKFIINGIKAIIKWIYKIFINPIVKLFSFIYNKFRKLFVNITHKIKKISQIQKYHLKKKHVLLYNLDIRKRLKEKGDKVNGKKKNKKE